MMYKYFIISILLFFSAKIYGQVSGNQVFNREYRERYVTPQPDKIILTDSTFFIKASVLKNVIADSYVVTLGVTESAKTLKEANMQIDNRIQKFIASLKSIDIPQKDTYVDITTQTKILDYKIDGDLAVQFVSGFEQKKNIILKIKDIKELDKIIVLASEYEIYDLIKVDYIVDDTNKIYAELLQTALELINNKKDLYVKATGIQLKNLSKINSESFYYLTPAKLYQSYTARNISTEFDNYSNNRKKKNLQVNTSYYYDNIDYSTFDKIINPIITEPAVEFVLILQLKYDLVEEK